MSNQSLHDNDRWFSQEKQLLQPTTTRLDSQYRASARPKTQHITWRKYEGTTLTAVITYKNADTQNWCSKSLVDLRKKPYKLVSLSEESTDFHKVSWLFNHTSQKQLKIHMIRRVENPYLFGCYVLKREELGAKEVNYFHGTKARNVRSICANNFDWRLHGDNFGNKFGQGVSFSPIANYSSHYCDNKPNCENVMFLARVLVTDYVLGSGDMAIPPHGYDTATKKSGHVVVKFSDSEFYPEFVIYYTGSAIKNTK